MLRNYLRLLVAPVLALLLLAILTTIFTSSSIVKAAGELPVPRVGCDLPPPLPGQGGGRVPTPISIPLCSKVQYIHGYIYFNGLPVTESVSVTVTVNGIASIAHSKQTTESHTYFELYSQLGFGAMPGDIVTLTASYRGSSRLVTYQAQAPGQQVDLVLSNVTFNCAAVTDIPPDECNALVDLYTYLNGTAWISKTGWLQNNRICQTAEDWAGIGCTRGHITRIKLNENGLTGVIPSSISKFTRLQKFEVYRNDISGSIPKGFGQLTDLQWLLLQENRLSGEMPSELGNLDNLQYLRVQHNQLSGKLPASLGQLTNLLEFFAYENWFSGEFPQQIMALPSLQQLRVARNSFSGALPILQGNSALLRIELSDNLFTEQVVVVDPASYSRLQIVDLGYNYLTGNLPTEVGQLPVIQFFFLHNNQLDGTIPAWIDDLTQLTNFDISANRLHGSIPVELCKLPQIATIDLNDNRFDTSVVPFCGNQLGPIPGGWQSTQTEPPRTLSAEFAGTTAIKLQWDQPIYFVSGSSYSITITSLEGVRVLSRPWGTVSHTVSDMKPNVRYTICIHRITPAHDDQKNILVSDPRCTTAERILPTNTDTPTPTPTATAIDGANPTSTSTSSTPPTPTYTFTATPTDTPTDTPTPTNTNSATPVATSTTEWTMLIYAAADNNLAPYLGETANGLINRFREVASVEGVNVGMLYDGPQNDDSRLYTVDSAGIVRTEEINFDQTMLNEVAMDDPKTLRAFINWGRKSLPANHYYLAIADHANGIVGIAEDDTSAKDHPNPYLTPDEIDQALGLDENGHLYMLDIVHFDGCSFGLFENLSIVKDVADYVIFSPNTGWGIFDYPGYRKLIKKDLSSSDLVKKIARHYADSLQGEPYTISAIDMNYYQETYDGINTLAQALTNYVDKPNHDSSQSIRELRARLQKYDSGDLTNDDADPYVDIIHMSKILSATEDNPIDDADVREAARDLVEPFDKLLIENLRGSNAEFVYRNKSRKIKLDDVEGLGIYFPAFETLTAAGATCDISCQYKSGLVYPQLKDWKWLSFISLAVQPLPGGTEETSLELIAPVIVEHSLFLPLVQR